MLAPEGSEEQLQVRVSCLHPTDRSSRMGGGSRFSNHEMTVGSLDKAGSGCVVINH